MIEERLDRPWMPPGMELAVGDRVVVRLNGECRQWSPPLEGMKGAEVGIWYEHDDEADGHVGTVVGVYPDDEAGHPYEVRADEPWLTLVLHDHAFRIAADTFARAELTRVGR
jgi:hypothetical protein